MKKIFYLLVAFTLLVVSCEKEPSEQDTNQPTVSVSVMQNFNADQTATLVIDLSKTSDKEVVVNLIETDVESGKTKLPVNFENTIIIPAGNSKATVEVVADTDNLEIGNYQSAIKIGSAGNAVVGDKSVVYLNYTVEQGDTMPTVTISADEFFNSENISNLTVSLSSSSNTEVVVNLIETDAESGKTKLPVNFENTITIPAGTTEVSIDIVADIENLLPGNYQSAIKIESAENANVNEEDVVYINYQGEIGPLFTSLELDEVLASDDFEETEPWINFDQENVDTKLNNAMGGSQQYQWTNTWGGACVHEGKSAVDGNNCLQIHWGGTVRLQDFTIDPDKIYQLEVMVHPLGGISGEWNNWAAVHLFVFDQSNVWQNQGVKIRLSNNDVSGNSPALLALDVWEGEEGTERPVNLLNFSDKWQEYTIDDAEDGTPSFWVPLKLIFKGKGTTDNPFMIDFYLNDEYVASQSFDDLYWLGDSMIGFQNGSDNEDLCRFDNFKLSVMRDSSSSEN